ncbi:MAG TPA: S41 family peptidase [Flavipsychrobacter sp.]|nr:S41 family peptidase [Flavipsychrobacter sp.]
MNDARRSRLKVWTPLLFSLIMIFGMVLGFNLRDTLRNKRDIQTIIERNDRLEQIIDLINEKYVDSVNTNLLYEDAITGILRHLDPHTVYIAPDELQSVNEDLEGSFFGIGVEFSIIKDTIQVTSVIEGGPAQRAGVDIGDKLIKVGDSVVAGTGITSDRIIKMLRGKQHSKVLVTLQSAFRPGQKRVIIERDAIPLYSVEANLMLDNQTAYIRINRFSATTYEEFQKALTELKGKGATSLVLDLRQNPGGYLDAATSVADEFLDDKKLIVYTQGLHTPRMDYNAGKEGMFEKGKLAVLVDESSASASEILAGAIQDWDRGTIIGRRTYGKGLVQEQYEMENGAALRLTIARYYTPSGRCIQRSYAKGKEAYAEDFSKRFSTGELTGTDIDSSRHSDTTKYYTHNKRLVYGGGGITPDFFVPYDTTKLNAALLNVIFSESTKNFLWSYFLQHRNELRQYKTYESFQANFDREELLEAFAATIPAKLQKPYRYVLKQPESKKYLQTQLKAQLARFLFRNNGYYYIEAKTDDVIQKALQVLNSNKYLSSIGR